MFQKQTSAQSTSRDLRSYFTPKPCKKTVTITPVSVPLKDGNEQRIRNISDLGLNPEQSSIVTARTKCSQVILAGAGSGKTRTICARALYLLTQGIDATNILLLTFTKKAALEMKERLELLKLPSIQTLPQTRTIHSLCLELVTQHFSLLGFEKSPRIISSRREKLDMMHACIIAKFEWQLLAACQKWLKLEVTSKPGSKTSISDWEVITKEMENLSIKVPPTHCQSMMHVSSSQYSQGVTQRSEFDDSLDNEEQQGIAVDTFDDRVGIYRCLFEKYSQRESNLAGQYQTCLENLAFFLDFVQYAKVRQFEPRHYGSTEPGEMYKSYQQLLKESCRMDFEDILFFALELLKSNEPLRKRYNEKYQYLLIDELQDLNALQMEFCSLLRPNGEGLTVVGDDDQAVYSFRGARSRLNFELISLKALGLSLSSIKEKVETDKGAIYTLTVNYRSSWKILELANQLISQSVHRLPKPLMQTVQKNLTSLPIDVWEFPDPDMEAQYLASVLCDLVRGRKQHKWKDCAILFRCTKLGSYQCLFALKRALNEQLIPFTVLGDSTLSEEPFLNMALQLLRISSSGQGEDDAAFSACFIELVAGMGSKRLEQIRKYAQKFKGSLQDTEEAVRYYYNEKKRGGEKGKRIRVFLTKLDQTRTSIPGLSLQQAIELVFETFLSSSSSSTGGGGGGGGNNYNSTKSSNNSKKRKPEKKEELSEYDQALIMLLQLAKQQQQQQQVKGQKEDGRQLVRFFLTDMALMEGNEEPTHLHRHEDKVCITTVHQAKGLEWPVVFIPHLNEGFLPVDQRQPAYPLPVLGDAEMLSIPQKPGINAGEHREEERRIAYVAFTRAKLRLCLSFIRYRQGQREMLQPSTFLGPFLKPQSKLIEYHSFLPSPATTSSTTPSTTSSTAAESNKGNNNPGFTKVSKLWFKGNPNN